MSTIGELERRAGITDRTAFWMQFSHLRGTVERCGKAHSIGLEAGIAELRRLVAEREGEKAA